MDFHKCTVMVAMSLTLVSSSATPADQTQHQGHQQLVVIDTDPGVDDMMALLMVLGDPNSRVVAITCVRGNVPSHQAAVNVLKILQLAKRYDVPVYSGNDYGLVETVPADGYFGADGLMNVTFPKVPNANVRVEEEHAASFMARIVQEYPGKINFLALGPLTNFALALHLNPEFLRQAQRVVILGGSVTGRGNVLPGLEFNFYIDAAAAHVVLEFAALTESLVTIVPKELINYDLTYEWRWNTVSKLNNSVVQMLDKVERVFQEQRNLTQYHPLDMYAAGDLISGDFVSHSLNRYAFVEKEGQRLRGYLAVDFDDRLKRPANVEVIMEVNLDVLKKTVVDSLARFT